MKAADKGPVKEERCTVGDERNIYAPEIIKGEKRHVDAEISRQAHGAGDARGNFQKTKLPGGVFLDLEKPGSVEGKPAVNVFRNRLKLFGEREVAGADGDAGTDPFTGAGTDEAENAVPVGKAVYRQFLAGKILTDGVFGAV